MNGGPVNPANLPPPPKNSSVVPWVIGGFACLLLFLGLAGGVGAVIYRAELSEMFPQNGMPGPDPHDAKMFDPYDHYAPPVPTAKKSAFYPDPLTAGCPGGHTLAEFRTPSGSTYSCNVCGQTFPPRTRMFGCRICNWDKCERCANGP